MMRQINPASRSVSAFLSSCGALTLLANVSLAAPRITLVDFGRDAPTTRTPYSDWTTVLRHPLYTAFIDPDGNSNHWGIVDVNPIPDGQFSYAGISGSTPITLREGQKIVATFYNRSSGEEYLMARVSFSDSNSPDMGGTNRWFSMYGVDEEETTITVPGRTIKEFEFYITSTSHVTALDVPSTEATVTQVTISKPDNSPFTVLTRLEISDETDFTPPLPPGNLRASPFAMTTGCSSNAVRLTWTPSTDPPPHATGVSRYLIYRDGVLYDQIPSDIAAVLNTNLFYIDLAVVPERRYTYAVTAIDKAPLGMYPTRDRADARHGNESAFSAATAITTPPWSSSTLLNLSVAAVYRGAFRLPYSEGEPWAYASSGITYSPGGNPGHNPDEELTGSLYALTQLAGEVGELSIPIPVVSTNAADLPTARTLRPPVSIWPAVYSGSSTPRGGAWRSAGIGYHPASNGVPEQIYYGCCNSYGTDERAPAHGAFSLDLGAAVGAWHIGALPPDNVHPALVSKIVFAIPPDWAAKHTGGRSLIVGNTYLSGCGVPSHGASLYAVAPWETGVLPANGAALSSVELLRYSSGATVSNRTVNWSMDENAEGGAWLRVAGHDAVALSSRRNVGEVWYGDTSGGVLYEFNIPEPTLLNRGIGATAWKTAILTYAPAELAAVAAGTLRHWQPQPYQVFDLDRFSIMPGGGDGTAGDIAYDAAHQRLFFFEHNGDPGHEYGYGLVHVFELAMPPYRPRLSLNTVGTAPYLEWQTEAGGSTQYVQRTTTLYPTAQWHTVGAPFTADGTRKRYGPLAVPRDPEAGFFRVQITPPLRPEPLTHHTPRPQTAR